MTKRTHPLTRYREEHSLSLTKLASEMGVSKATLSRWESGQRRPSRRFLPLIARLTKTSIPALMGMEG